MRKVEVTIIETVQRFIYGYREISTGKFWYVGQTKSPAIRDKAHRRHWKSAVTFARAVLWVRPDDFEFVILDSGAWSLDDANWWENYYMVVKKTFHTFGDHGYNLYWAVNGPPTDGGREANRVAHQKPEYRAKLKRRIKTPETRRLNSIAAKARLANPRNHPRFGKHWDEAHRKAVGDVHRGKLMSDSHRTAIFDYWQKRATFFEELGLSTKQEQLKRAAWMRAKQRKIGKEAKFAADLDLA